MTEKKRPKTIQEFYFESSGGIPNNSNLPLLIYMNSFKGNQDVSVKHYKHRYSDNNWSGIWQNGVYGFHHYHSNAHEVLGVAQGEGNIQFGGTDGPELNLKKGDTAILPAGTGHKKNGSSRDFLVVGAYPVSQSNWDLKKEGGMDLESADKRIANVDLPAHDPLFGESGPLINHWLDS